jgi:hypothetical protein
MSKLADISSAIVIRLDLMTVLVTVGFVIFEIVCFLLISLAAD